ncbi:MAG: hypothetical protein AAF669_08290 [Pseudomonadota bacterium]
MSAPDPALARLLKAVPDSLPVWLTDQLAPLARQHRLIHVCTPLTWQQAQQAERDAFFADLNNLRESLAATCRCSLLFWLSETAPAQLALMAPDLWN